MSESFDWDRDVLNKQEEKQMNKSASDYLIDANNTLTQRGKDYDYSIEGHEQSERSMGKTIEAFNSITGNQLDEQDGWLILLLLKQVRQYSSSIFHQDSAIDSVGYAALLAESLETNKPPF